MWRSTLLKAIHNFWDGLDSKENDKEIRCALGREGSHEKGRRETRANEVERLEGEGRFRRYLRQELGSVLPVHQVPPCVNVGNAVVAAVNVVSVLCEKQSEWLAISKINLFPPCSTVKKANQSTTITYPKRRTSTEGRNLR